jgi:hypothetical protein
MLAPFGPPVPYEAVRVRITLASDLLEQIDRLAESRGVTRGTMIRMLLYAAMRG